MFLLGPTNVLASKDFLVSPQTLTFNLAELFQGNMPADNLRGARVLWGPLGFFRFSGVLSSVVFEIAIDMLYYAR